MQISVRKPFRYKGQKRAAGDTLDVPDGQARVLIAVKLATQIKAPQQAPVAVALPQPEPVKPRRGRPPKSAALPRPEPQTPDSSAHSPSEVYSAGTIQQAGHYATRDEVPAKE